MIQPLGEQIIIRTIPPTSVGSIIIPDAAKGITHQGEKGDLVHFVEAEVIAVGPGKRFKGDPDLIPEMVTALRDAAQFADSGVRWSSASPGVTERANNLVERLYELARRASSPHRIEPLVKPGDRILYHPSVQRFDRKVDGLGEGDYYIILENSVLAILDPKEEEAAA